MHSPAPARTSLWKWLVCGLLLLATMLNYMDRLTLNLTIGRVMEEFEFKEATYGQLEAVFAIAFAVGALGAGWLVDRGNVWWIYPAALFAWSLAGFATGFAQTLVALFVCRFLLGLMESGHWPCALRTTQRILPPEQRTLGNSILQSGAALGSIVTPLIVNASLESHDSWRPPFWIVGGLGFFWIVAWLMVVRPGDMALPPVPPEGQAQGSAFYEVFQDRRFWVLAFVVVCINGAWHFFRVWLPLFLRKVHGYEEVDINVFISCYYLSTDVGALLAGFGALWLARRGVSVHASRLWVYFGGALLTTLSLVVGQLAAGPLLLAMFLVIGFGALAVFPPFYSFTQELTVQHQGKLTGTIGCISWLSMAVIQWLVGKTVEETGSYSLGLERTSIGDSRRRVTGRRADGHVGQADCTSPPTRRHGSAF